MQAKLSAMETESEKFDEWFTSQNYKEDVMGYFLDYFNAYNKNQESIQQNYREAFQIQKQLMITQYLIKHKASRLDQLSTRQYVGNEPQNQRTFQRVGFGQAEDGSARERVFY